MKVLLLLLLPFFAIAQIKGDNQIIVKNVTFSQVVNNLLDSGYVIKKIDSNYKTVSTEWKNCPLKNGKTSLINMALYIRVKDSTAFINGTWYSLIFLNDREPGPMDIYKIENSWGADKLLFGQLNKFASSFKQPVEYRKL